jgi:micrococcal nuclease
MPETTLTDRVYEKALKHSTTPAEIINRGLNGREFVKKYLQYGSQIWIEFDEQKRDRFSRLLGYVYLSDGRMLNEIILRAGLSEPLLVAPNLKYQQRFQEIARLAQKSKGKPKPVKAKPAALKK